ncbi:hypothetical protein FRB91_010198 [Serendipita sp. 411]|nr:hypothetical protein FRB91_010198 [Serendipita sp. 411]
MVQWGLLSPEPDQHFGPIERLLKGEMGESESSKVVLDRELIPLALHYLDLQPSERSDLWSRYLVAFSISITIPYESLTSVKALSDEGLETGLHIFRHQLAIYNSPTDSLLLDDLSELEINAIKEFGSSLISQYTMKLATSATVGSMNQALGHLLSLLDEYPMTREDRFKHHATCAYPTHRLRKVSLIPRIHEVLKQVVLAKEKHPEWVISPTVEEATSDEAPVKRSKRLIEPIGSKDEEWIHLDVGSTSSSIQEQVVGRSWIDSIDEIVEMVHIFDMLLQNGCSEDEHTMLIKLVIQHLGSYSTSFIQRRISRKELAFLSLIQDASLRLIASRISNVSYPNFNIPSAGSNLWASGAWKTAIEYWLRSHNGTLTYMDRVLFANGLLQGNSDVHTLLIDATLIHPQLQAQVVFILEYGDLHPRDGILETITRCLHVRNAPWFQKTMEAEDRFDGILEKITELTPLDRIRLLPLLSTLMDSIGGIPSRMIAITDIIHSTLAIEHSVLLQQDEVDEVAQRLEHLPVAALQAIRSLEMSDPIQARAVLTRVDRIIRMLREAEDVHRALTQWNSARSSCFQEF